MADKKFQLGFERKLYRNTGTSAVPVWTLMNNVSNVKTNFTAGETDVTTRGNNGWKATAPTLNEAELTFTMIYDPTSTDFDAIRTGFFNKAPIEFAVADGPIATSGTEYLRVTCGIFNFGVDESNEEAVKVEVTAKPTYASNAPEYLTTA